MWPYDIIVNMPIPPLVTLLTILHIEIIPLLLINNLVQNRKSFMSEVNLYSQTCVMWPSKGIVKYGHMRKVVT
jgi:hypothetical protein